MFDCIGDGLQDNEIFREQGLEFRPVAVVGVDRCDQIILVVFQETRQRPQVSNALSIGWLRRRQVSRTLLVKAGLKFSGNVDRTGIDRHVHDVPFLLVFRVSSKRNNEGARVTVTVSTPS